MKRHWQIGEHAILYPVENPLYRYMEGTEVIVASELAVHDLGEGALGYGYLVHTLHDPEDLYLAHYRNLQEKPDHNEKGSWENCVWKPKAWAYPLT